MEFVELGRHGAEMVPHFVAFAWYELSLNIRDVNEHEVPRECGILLRKVQNRRRYEDVYKYSMLESIRN